MHRLEGKKALFSVLNWGLGHATRSIPLIKFLSEDLGLDLMLASDGGAKKMLMQVFPNLPCLSLPPYDIHYQKKGSLNWTLLKQSKKLTKAIDNENGFCQTLAQEHDFDFCISDNRYGCYLEGIPNILISHQLQLQVSGWSGIFKGLAQKKLNSWLKNFDQLWIPDFPNSSLSGKLSESRFLRAKQFFIDPLSRFESLEKMDESTDLKVEKSIDLLVILSGPEPQRTLLEKKVFKIAKGRDLKLRLLRGKPEAPQMDSEEKGWDIFGHLNDSELAKSIKSAKLVVSRPGYSSIMDYNCLGGNFLLVPTPGQGEQEYLAKKIRESACARTVSQSTLGWEAVKKAMEEPFSFKTSETGFNKCLVAEQLRKLS